MSEPTTDAYGTLTWRDDSGEFHRDGDLPAVVWPDGSRFWYQHGQRHRDANLPAKVYPDGSQIWYQHGRLHRSHDLPAVVWADGAQEWYQHGKLHRDGDLPAIVLANGLQEWWVNSFKQTPADRAQTQKAMAEARRWSPLRAAFVGAAACAPPRSS